MDITSFSDKIKIYEDVLEINTKFPSKKYDKLLKDLGVDRTKKPTDELIQKAFINSIQLFLKGKLSQDELSSIANVFWGTRKEKSDELAQALYECSELTFYIRRIYKPDIPKDNGNFTQFMTTTMKYYEKYIKLLNNLQH
ncbi:MAG: hypothetical protein AAB609_02135 [Patescibacteria group bacterium]